MEYIYLVAFFNSFANGAFGMGNATAILDHPLEDIEEIHAIEKKLATENGAASLVMINFQLLRTKN